MITDELKKKEEMTYHDNTYENYIKEYIKSPLFRSIRDHLQKKLNKIINDDDLILEVGCGPIPNEIGNNVVGIDFSLNSLMHARKYSKNLVCCDIEKLPFKSDLFNTVICYGVLHHIPNLEKSLDNITYVLKDGGTFFTIEPSELQNPHLHSPHEKGFNKNFLINIINERFNIHYVSNFWTFRFIHSDSVEKEQNSNKLKFFSIIPGPIKYYINRFQLLIEEFMQIIGIEKSGFWIVLIGNKK